MLTALALFALIAAASARPRFIAVPIEDVRFIDTPYGRQMVFAPQPMEQHRISRRAGIYILLDSYFIQFISILVEFVTVFC